MLKSLFLTVLSLLILGAALPSTVLAGPTDRNDDGKVTMQERRLHWLDGYH